LGNRRMKGTGPVFFVVFVTSLFITSLIVPLFICWAIAVAVSFAYDYLWRIKQRFPSTGGVLISGTSTGFGEAISIRLANSGIVVFAGVRKLEDGEKLKAKSRRPENIRPVILDVTDSEHIKAAVELIAGSEIPLIGVVNNAGLGFMEPLEGSSWEDIRKQYDVNVFGHIAVTRAVLPLLRRAPSGLPRRIVFVSSLQGRVSIPFYSIYSSTKYAIESLADGLRLELAPWNIRVSLIEPGIFKTNFQASHHDPLIKLDDQVLEIYQKRLSKTEKTIENSRKFAPSSLDWVTNSIEDSLLSRIPNTRYTAGYDSRFLTYALQLLPEQLADILLGFSF